MKIDFDKMQGLVPAIIQDSAGELWAHISSGNALFTLADGNGRVIASLGDESPFQAGVHLNFVETLARRFPEQLVQIWRHVVRGGCVDAHDALRTIELVAGTQLESRHAFRVDADEM